MLGLEQKNGHLVAADRVARAVVPAAAASGDARRRESLDPRGGEGAGRHVGEHGSGRGRRDVGRAVLRAQQEDGHLRARDGAGGAVVSETAARGDGVAHERLDEIVEQMRLRHVREIREPAVGDRVRSSRRMDPSRRRPESVPGASGGVVNEIWLPATETAPAAFKPAMTVASAGSLRRAQRGRRSARGRPRGRREIGHRPASDRRFRRRRSLPLELGEPRGGRRGRP